MYLLLPYQQRWVNDKSRVKICEKSRRIGITWATAVSCVTDAADGTHDSYYIGYNEDQALEFIRDVEWWCRSLHIVQPKHVEEVYVDEDGNITPYLLKESDIKGYRVEFFSGKRITALSSRPRNLRGKGGRVVIDEAAFHDNLQELIKAAMALLMWGGMVEIISTHNGSENPFNVLIQDVEAGKFDYSHHRITLDDALAEGLYERICLMTKVEYTPQAQEKWRQELIDHYGVGAGEELFCQPLSLSEGVFFNRTWFQYVDELPRDVGMCVRYWDLASTEKKKENDPDYTASVKMYEHGDNVIIDDATMDMEDPGAVESLLTSTADMDGVEVLIGVEEEPGSSGKLYTHHLSTGPLARYMVEPVRNTGPKVERAKPLSTAAKAGRVYVRRAPWNADFLTILHKFPFGRYDDPVDASSGAYNMIKDGGTALWIKAVQNR